MKYGVSLGALREIRGPVPSHRESSWQRIIVVSNRLPFTIASDASGNPCVLPSSGGLVTAMTPLLERGIAGMWIGWPGGDTEGLEEALGYGPESQLPIGIVTLTEREEEEYYRGYANQVLVPLLVGEVGAIDQEKALTCWHTYQTVQRKFADKIAEHVAPTDVVWVHDFHLIGVAQEARNRGITQPLVFFLHMPFPSKEMFLKLQHSRQLLRDLLAYDVIGFQTITFERNFIEAVRLFIPDAQIQVGANGIAKITYQGRTTRLGSFPISIDTGEFQNQLHAPETQRNIVRLRKVLSPVRLILSVGRLDYSKGFLEELMAFDLLLEQHPELVGSVVLYQLVIPSRAGIPAYSVYRERICALANSINEKYGARVVRQVHRSMSRAKYLAFLHTASVADIPTLADGMNLIAKEWAVAGDPAASLLLSRRAGVVEEFGEDAILFDPEDIDAFATAMLRALVMSKPERRAHKRALMLAVIANDIFNWAERHMSVFQTVWSERASAI